MKGIIVPVLDKQQKAYSCHDEIEKFTALAQDWWDPNGKMRPLHQFNPVRVSYAKSQICKALELDESLKSPLSGLRILDVGCGGGLLSESMALLGASVVGVDASQSMIEVARIHAKQSDLDIEYHHQDVQEVLENGEKFDVVISMEVVEHVTDPDGFLKTCGGCVRDEGVLMVSTINRTMKSYALAIVGAEYVLKWLPKGTHDWNMFLKPSEICHMVADNFIPYHMGGITYHIFESTWRLQDNDLDVNYIATFVKNNA